MNEDYMPRKLDIVYKHIDSGNYKAAIKLCQKKDIQGWDITKALLAYCYVSLHRNDEALQVAREVKAKNPTDETVLNTLSLVFKAARSEEDILGCYENALKIQPNNDVLIVELFCCYVKLRDSKRQQQLAMKLYKSTGNPKFVFWSVASMLHPSIIANNILQLGEKMLSKVLYDGNGITPGSEELQLYIEVICRQNRHSDALTELNKLISRAKQHPTEPFKDEMEFKKRYSSVPIEDLQLSVLKCKLLQEDRDLAASLSDSTIITEIIKSEVLHNYPDHWAGHKLLVQQIIQMFPIPTPCTTTASVIELQQTAAAVEEEVNEQKLDEDFTLFSSHVSRHQRYLQQLQTLHPSSRGPLLAQLLLLVEWDKLRCRFLPSDCIIPNDWKLCKMQTEQTCSIYVSDELVNLLYFYYHTFGDRQCCFSDIAPFLQHLKNTYPESVVTLFQRFSETATSLSSLWDTGSTEIAENLTISNNNVCRFVKVNQILNFLQDDVSEAAEAIIRKYPLFLKIFLSSCENSDFAAKDDSLLLLCSAFSRRCCSYSSSSSMSPVDATAARGASGSAVRTVAAMPGGAVTIPSVTEIDAARKFIGSIQTVLLSKVGLQAHPQSFGYMLAALEPYRQLVAGAAATLTFNRLGVKYVQTDSMSYLLLPALLESGMLEEAIRMMKSVAGFHSGVSRETVESICHCFQFGNYMKSLELWKFIDRCQNSMQLAIVKAELPLLLLAHNLCTVQEATENLRDGIFSKPVGGQAATSDVSEMVNRLEAGDNSDIGAMTVNMDYELLPLSGWSGEGGEREQAAAARKQQYVQRIRQGRLMQRLLLCLLDNEGKKACRHIDALVTLTATGTGTATGIPKDITPSSESTDQEYSSSSSTEPITQVAESTNTTTTTTSPAIIWSQAIKAGESEDGFEALLFSASSRFLYVCSYWEQYSANLFNKEAGLPFDDNDDVFAAFTNYQLECLSAINDLSIHLLSSEYRYFAPLPSFTSTSDPVVNKEKESTAAAAAPVARLLRPSWIQKLSAFQLGLGNWGPLLISFLFATLTAHLPETVSLTAGSGGGGGSESGKKKKGSKNKSLKSEVAVKGTAAATANSAATASPPPATTQLNAMATAMKEVFSALATAIDKIKLALTVELQVSDEEKLQLLSQYLSHWSQRLEMENSFEDGLSIFYQTECNSNSISHNSSNSNKKSTNLGSDGDSDIGAVGQEELRKALASVKTEIVQAHRTSCKRTRDSLRDKLALIPNIIS